MASRWFRVMDMDSSLSHPVTEGKSYCYSEQRAPGFDPVYCLHEVYEPSSNTQRSRWWILDLLTLHVVLERHLEALGPQELNQHSDPFPPRAALVDLVGDDGIINTWALWTMQDGSVMVYDSDRHEWSQHDNLTTALGWALQSEEV